MIYQGQPNELFFHVKVKCEHVWDHEVETKDEEGNVRGSSLACSKCGTTAMHESMWGPDAV